MRGHLYSQDKKMVRDRRFRVLLYSTGAVKKKRVSWVLRREVCTWFCLATCTHNRNEGKKKEDGRHSKETCLKTEKSCKARATQPHTGHLKTDSRGSQAEAQTAINTQTTLPSWPPTTPSHPWPPILPPPPNLQFSPDTGNTGNEIEKGFLATVFYTRVVPLQAIK